MRFNAPLPVTMPERWVFVSCCAAACKSLPQEDYIPQVLRAGPTARVEGVSSFLPRSSTRSLILKQKLHVSSINEKIVEYHTKWKYYLNRQPNNNIARYINKQKRSVLSFGLLFGTIWSFYLVRYSIYYFLIYCKYVQFLCFKTKQSLRKTMV